jgi:fission process protein 1
VAQSRKVFRSATNPKVRTWGPTMTGLAIVPILPYLFDHPVEHVTDRAFDWIRTKLIENNTTKSNAERKEL